jgi:WD40 repeat protein
MFVWFLFSHCSFQNDRLFSSSTFELLAIKEAHDSEILSLDFLYDSTNDIQLLSSASRDRLVHVFEIDDKQQSKVDLIPRATLDDHSAAVTATKFDKQNNRLISCGVDKSIFFRNQVSVM